MSVETRPSQLFVLTTAMAMACNEDPRPLNFQEVHDCNPEIISSPESLERFRRSLTSEFSFCLGSGNTSYIRTLERELREERAARERTTQRVEALENSANRLQKAYLLTGIIFGFLTAVWGLLTVVTRSLQVYLLAREQGLPINENNPYMRFILAVYTKWGITFTPTNGHRSNRLGED